MLMTVALCFIGMFVFSMLILSTVYFYYLVKDGSFGTHISYMTDDSVSRDVKRLRELSELERSDRISDIDNKGK